MKLLPAITLTALALLSQASQGAIVVTAPTITNTGSFQITTNLTFTLIAPATFGTFYVVFDEFVAANDGTRTGSNLTVEPTVTLSPGGAYLGAAVFNDNWVTPQGTGITANDAVLSFTTITNANNLVAGNTVTINAGTFTLTQAALFNSATTKTFNGNIYLADLSGNRISNIIPEPSTVLLSAGALAVGLVRRRRK